jgi:hypothetical protein
MKSYIRHIILLVLAVWLGPGCSLETVDRAALSPPVALDNINGVQSAVLSAYQRTHAFVFYGQQANIHGDVLADNMTLVNRTGRYEQEYVNAVGVLVNRWAGRYAAINDCNFVLRYIEQINPNTIPTTAAINAAQVIGHLRGEALFLRALNYHELARVYAYEPGREVNGFNLGVVMRTTPTEVKSDADNRSRGTNLELYQLIEADLLQAINGLLTVAQVTPAANWPLTPAVAFPFRATRAAAHALLARVYLYWGRWADADAQATLALSLVPVSAPVGAAGYVASFSTATHPESIFESEIRPPDWSGVDGPNNSMNSITTNMLGGSQYVVAGSQELINAHEPGDVRRNLYINTAATLNRFQSRKWPGEKGNFLENIPVIRRSEMYLIQAEARARQTGLDASAQAAINILRTNRGLSPTTLTGAALINLIMNERRVELAFEGHRWFDFKRLGMNVTKGASSGAPTVPYTDFRMLQQIPPDQIILNPLIEQNPGY